MPTALAAAPPSSSPNARQGRAGRLHAREQEAAEREPGQVGRQHHREGVRARAQELHEQLGPGDLVAERDPAGDGVEGEGETGVVRQRRRGRRGRGSLGRRPLRRRSSARAAAATARPRRPATSAERVMPKAGTSRNGVASVPRTAPVVLAP